MGVDFSPSTPAARPRASAAAPSASAVKVARTRSARLPLASNGGPRIEYRSTVRLRQAACTLTPGGVRFVGVLVGSHVGMIPSHYVIIHHSTLNMRIYASVNKYSD